MSPTWPTPACTSWLGYDGWLVNIRTESLKIRERAKTVMDWNMGSGKNEFDATKPDGTPHKLPDVSRLSSLGWRSSTTLRDGIRLVMKERCGRAS
jgi:GDP-L-fucose synthase